MLSSVNMHIHSTHMPWRRVLFVAMWLGATMTAEAWSAEHAPRSRAVVTAEHGVVATSQPLAVQVGVDILKAGGNAADAAIAANAMIGLTEPMSCGIGGDLFVIYWDAKTQKLYGLNASGRSPHSLTREVFAERGLKEIPEKGPLSWSVPGCVSGWDELRGKFGTKPLAELLAPAIRTAEEGFPVTEVIAGYWRSGEAELKKTPDAAATYLPGGHAPKAGEVFRNPRLAATYNTIAEQGPNAFYQGPIAEKIVEFSRKKGGYFELRDFTEHRSDWVEPVSTNYRGYDVWELPPNGQGIAVLQMLNLLEPYDLRSMGAGSAEFLHLFLEVKKLAYADRARFYSDPEFVKPPVAKLISKQYAEERRKKIDRDRAATNIPHGDPKLVHGDTIYLTVVDKDRNCCSLIQSNYFGFGSGLVPGELGFALQNRGNLFALDENHPNCFEPHKRPFHTIIPAMVTKDDKPWFCFGVMGGDMQPQGHVQVLVNLIDFGMDVQQAGDAPRVRHDGSATPTGKSADSNGGVVFVEAGISDKAIARLRDKQHDVRSATSGGFGGYQGILIDWENGVLRGGSESRKDGHAQGY
jgi:gamma-glutamyltranspeptidase / glutathione hydrolase